MSAAVTVKNLSKRYRIGLAEVRSDSFIGQIGNFLKSPFRNLANLRRLSTFSGEDDSVHWALRDINFEVKEGEVLGVIGHNGAGKSTLLKVLSRITEPTTGEVILHGRVSSLLEVGTGFHPDLSGRENIYMNGTILGMTKREIDRKFEEIVEFSGVSKYLDTPVKRYSSGMKVRLAFSVAAHLEPEILIIDEVLAVGDIDFQQKCLSKMEKVSNEGRTVLFVSHNMSAIASLCTRGIVLNGGRLAFSGDVNSCIARYMDYYRSRESFDGTINESRSTVSTGEAKFRSIRLLDLDGNHIRRVSVSQRIRMEIVIDVFTKLSNAIVDVKIVAAHGAEIVHLMSLYDDGLTFNLQGGGYVLTAEVDNVLQPGSYAFTIGIHHSNGYTIDYVESVHSFEVLLIGGESGVAISDHWVHGFVRLNTEWTLVNS